MRFFSIKGRLKSAVGRGGYFLWKDASPVFLLSTGRTGTDSLHYLLSLCEDIKSSHEPRPQLLLERQQAYQYIDKTPGKFADIFKSARGYELLKCEFEKMQYVETSARMTFFAPVIAKLLPNAKFIYMYRHPGQIVRSGMRRRWYKDHPADKFRITPREDEPVFHEWDEMPQFEKICWYWAAYNRFSLEFIKTINKDRCLFLGAEEFFTGKEEMLQRLFDFVGTPVPDQSQVKLVMSKKHNAQKDTEFPEFAEWADKDKQMLYRYASKEIIELGYGNDFEFPGQENIFTSN